MKRNKPHVPLGGGRYPAMIALIMFVGVGLFGAAIIARGADNAFPLEWEWLEFLKSLRSPASTSIALFLNRLGGTLWGGIVVPVAVVGVLALSRRYSACGLLIISLVTSAAAVQAIKHLVLRVRPPEMMVSSDVGSFPSGHVANATTLVVVLALIFRRTWVWILGSLYVLAMIVSRCYLAVHWLGDTIGGTMLGGGVVLLVWWVADIVSERLNRTPSGEA